MKNNILTEVLNYVGVAARKIKQHIVELMSPETPSYKTSATAAPFFAILAATAGERATLFWISLLCMLFFILLAVSQYGVFSKTRKVPTNSSSNNNQ